MLSMRLIDRLAESLSRGQTMSVRVCVCVCGGGDYLLMFVSAVHSATLLQRQTCFSQNTKSRSQFQENSGKFYCK